MSGKTQTVDVLTQLLTTGDAADRCYAARALGRLRDPRAADALVERLRDEDIDVCVDAAEALGHIGEPATIPALLESLEKDPSGEVKTAVVEALGNIGTDPVIAPLMRVAATRPQDMGWEEDPSWDSWWDMQLKAVEALGRLRTVRAIPVLADILQQGDTQDIESEVLSALARIGGEGEKLLIKRLQNGTARERRRAAKALALCSSKRAGSALRTALTDGEADVRVAAALALGRLVRADVLLDLFRVAQSDPIPEVRQAALEGIRELTVAGPGAVAAERITPFLSDTSPAVRRTALHIIGRGLRGRPGLALRQLIRERLLDEDPRVAAAACEFVGVMRDAAALPTLLTLAENKALDAALRREAISALGRLRQVSGKPVQALLRALNDPAQPVRLAAVWALAHLENTDGKHRRGRSANGRPRAKQTARRRVPSVPFAVLLSTLRGERPSPAPESLSSATVPAARSSEPSGPNVESRGDQRIAKSAADEGSESLARSAHSTLEAIAIDNVEAALLLEESAENPRVLSEADLPEELQEYLALVRENAKRDARSSPPSEEQVFADVRRLSARVLGEFNRREASAELINALDDEDPVLRREAAQALERIARRRPAQVELSDALGPLAMHMHGDDAEMRLACARALAALGNPGAIPALMLRLQDAEPAVRAEAVRALAALLPTAAEGSRRKQVRPLPPKEVNRELIIASIRNLLADPNALVRQAVAEVLAKLQPHQSIDRILAAGFADGGAQARAMARPLCGMRTSAKLAEALQQRLQACGNSDERRVVVEMMAEIYGQDPNSQPANGV